MVLYGCDVHPDFQRGLNIEQVRSEGFDFIAVKVSEDTDTYGGQDWLRRAKACGLIPMGYHYLRPGNEVEQAHVFAQQLLQADVPGMLDVEALAADGKTPTLTVAGIRQFLDAAALRGARVPLLYLPRWYHERMGSPDLSGLPRLWASGYVSGGGYAADLYQAVTPRLWAPYGGLPVAVLQFTNKALVAGQKIDADAFLGTRDELATLLTASMPTPIPPPLDPRPDSIPSMAFGQTSDDIRHLQDWCNKMFPLYSHLPVTGFYGDLTTAVIKEFQRRVGVVGGDGRNVGDQTKRALWAAGYRP
jgi:lysozyme